MGATAKQKKAVKAMVENGGVVSKAMVTAGYSPETAHSPKKLTESKGFKALCEEYGLTDELILTALVDDIKNKPKNRKPELELAAKMKGHLAEKVEHTGANGEPLVITWVHAPSDNSLQSEEVGDDAPQHEEAMDSARAPSPSWENSGESESLAEGRTDDSKE